MIASKLLTVNPKKPVTFSNDKDLTGLFTGLPVGRTHNVVVNEDTNFAYAVGAQPRNSTCRAGLIFIDLTDPSNPTSPGCAKGDGYVHDAQCVVYRGPDKQYNGREICYGYNEDTLTIYDVTDKKAPKILSNTSYEGASYTHQGWLLDKSDQRYLLLDDEYDEYDKAGVAADGHPVTYIWDVSNLSAPKQTGLFKNTNAYSVDHNQYVVDGLSFQSNYGSGFRVLDVSSIPRDPTGKGVKEVAFFDVYPEDDGMVNGGVIDFVGSWSSYAMFESGFIFINTIERGGFVVKMKKGRHGAKRVMMN
jgi:choice-of-anchor B domain-containing protein